MRQHFVGLLQLRVLHFGFFQDGDVGVSIVPEVEEIFVGSERPDNCRASYSLGMRLQINFSL